MELARELILNTDILAQSFYQGPGGTVGLVRELTLYRPTLRQIIIDIQVISVWYFRSLRA